MDAKEEQNIDRFQNALFQTARKLGHELIERMDAGLTGPQFYVLYLISEYGSCKVSRLAEKIEVKPSAITVMIDRMVARGFVERKNDENDRRVVLVKLTSEGREALDKLQEMRKQAIHQHLSQFSPEQIEEFLGILEKKLPNFN